MISICYFKNVVYQMIIIFCIDGYCLAVYNQVDWQFYAKAACAINYVVVCRCIHRYSFKKPCQWCRLTQSFLILLGFILFILAGHRKSGNTNTAQY
ncbi:hypothetical protein D3C86_1198830 [compost metagenome]